MYGGRKGGGGSTGRDSRSRSLQRMVRRCGHFGFFGTLRSEAAGELSIESRIGSENALRENENTDDVETLGRCGVAKDKGTILTSKVSPRIIVGTLLTGEGNARSICCR